MPLVRALDHQCSWLEPSVINSHADQVSSTRFRAVQRLIGTIEQIFSGLHFRLGEVSDTDTHRESQWRALADVEGVRLNLVAEPLGECNRAGLAGFRNRNHELVTTVTRHRIDTAR